MEEKYGKIRAIFAPRPSSDSPDKDPPGVGLIFVNFDALESAVQAQKRLNGRAFGDSVTDARFYDETAFSRQRFQ